MSFDLVTIDLNGTLLPGTTAFEEVLRSAGRGQEAREVRDRQARGLLDAREAFLARWAMVAELDLQELHRHLRRSAAWLPGIDEGVRRLRAAGLHVWLLTDQPCTITDFLMRWGFEEACCSPVEVNDGRQAGIEVRFDKLDNLRRSVRVPLHRVCHVGDGANDIPVFEAVGGSVAVQPRPGIAQAAQRVLPSPAGFIQVADAVLGMHGAEPPRDA